MSQIFILLVGIIIGYTISSYKIKIYSFLFSNKIKLIDCVNHINDKYNDL